MTNESATSSFRANEVKNSPSYFLKLSRYPEICPGAKLSFTSAYHQHILKAKRWFFWKNTPTQTLNSHKHPCTHQHHENWQIPTMDGKAETIDLRQ